MVQTDESKSGAQKMLRNRDGIKTALKINNNKISLFMTPQPGSGDFFVLFALVRQNKNVKLIN